MTLFNRKHSVLSQRKAMLAEFQKKINIRFKSFELLDLAFHHRSFSNEHSDKVENNERLEFLGDAVLGMVTAGYLYSYLEGHPEGDLAKIKSVVVSEMTLSQIALDIGIDKCLVLGKGEELSGGRQKKAILADAVEAVIGACYLDSGYRVVEKLVLELMIPEIDKVIENKHHKDYKTLLQEAYQKKSKICPKYVLEKTTGPDHDRTFWMSVCLGDTKYGPLSGKNKKEAEQAVAKLAWDAIEKSE